MHPYNRSLVIGLFVVLLLAVLFIFSGCSCNYHLKKAQAKCGNTTIHDTITVRDTIRIAETRMDTVFMATFNDTVYLDRDRLHIKYVKLAGDSVFIHGQCDSIVKYITVRVPYEKVVVAETWTQWFKRNSLWIIIILILLVTVRYLYKKFIQ